MYLDYWRLQEKPFEVATDTRFYCSSPNHEEALTRLLFACREHPGSMALTGDHGCGKTLLSRVLIRELARDAKSQLALIVNPRLSSREFLETILLELSGPLEGVPGDKNKVALLHTMEELLTHNVRSGRDTTLIIDEAQMITDDDVMEEIRLLMNLQSDNRLLLNIVFMGQPELKEKISRLKQLAQRVQMWFHLAPLSPQETQNYIRHRLRVAGMEAEIFSEDAYQRTHELTGGVPRLINSLCNMALWIGEKYQAPQIQRELIEMSHGALKG